MSVLQSKSQDSSSSSDSDSDDDKEQHNLKNRNSSVSLAANAPLSRKRKLSITSSSAKEHHPTTNSSLVKPPPPTSSTTNKKSSNNNDSGPPKKRQRTSNLGGVNSHTDSDEKQQRMKKSSKKTPEKASKKSKKKRKKSLSPVKKFRDGIKIEELECIVCRELPSDKIYQCENSHLLCKSCYHRISESAQCRCPECRVRMSRRRWPRNKLAENFLSAHLFECENKPHGCHDMIQFCYLVEHSRDECKYRQVECKFAPLGCQWRGLAKDRRPHYKTCDLRKTDPKKILKLVNALNARREELQAKKEKETERYVGITKLMELRARNVVVRDVRVHSWNENTKKTEVLNSNTFLAFGKRWQLQIRVEKVANPKQNATTSNSCVGSSANGAGEKMNKLWLRLQCLSSTGSLRKRLPLEVCVMKGPDFGYKLLPLRWESEFSKHKQERESKWIEMVQDKVLFNDEEVKNKFFTNYHTDNKVNLRVMLVDKRPNGVAHSFGGHGTHEFARESDFEVGSDAEQIGNGSHRNYSTSGDSEDSQGYSSTSSDFEERRRSRDDEEEDDDDDGMYSDEDDYSDSSSNGFY